MVAALRFRDPAAGPGAIAWSGPADAAVAAPTDAARVAAGHRLAWPTRLTRLTGCVVIVAALGACAPLPTRPIMRSHADAQVVERERLVPPSTSGFAPPNATPALRRQTLDLVWRTIEREFHDPHFDGIDLAALETRSRGALADVKSDADFYRVLQDGVRAMGDSHTGVLTPMQAGDERAQRADRIGLGFEIIDERVVVDQVLPDSVAAEAGVRRGMLIEAIDGRALDPLFLADAARGRDPGPGVDVTRAPVSPASPNVPGPRSNGDALQRQLEAIGALLQFGDGEANAHRVAFRRSDDTLLTVDLLARSQDFPPIAQYALRPSGVAVLRLSRFDPALLENIGQAIASARDDSRALIVDLRGDPGGDVDVMRRVLDQFIEEPASLGTIRVRLWRWTFSFDIDGAPIEHPYRKPLAVLIDGGTASAAEWTAHALVELRDALAVGEPTCGCVVGLFREFLLPDGGVLRVAEFGVRSPRGRRMEDDPLRPQLAVTETLADLRADDDVVLGAAERALMAR